VFIRGFDIKIGKATASGLELENLTTEVVLIGLMVVLLYLTATFVIRAFEEYRYWELTIPSEEAATWDGPIKVTDLANKMLNASDALDKVRANTGIIGRADREVLNEGDIRELKSAAEAAGTYAARFDNFPIIMRGRFWILDIGVTLITAFVGSSFYLFRCLSGLFQVT
jgi:hypothetical protein